MSSNHKAPLAAFVVVALACVVVLATNSMRSYARDAWRQFAAPVVTGLSLVPSRGGDSSTTPAGHDVAVDAPADTHSEADVTPAVVITKAEPTRQHHHRHHPAKTTPASDPAPQLAAPQPPVMPAMPATPAWSSHGPWHGNHSSWPAAVHQPTRTHPAGRSDHSTGLERGPSSQARSGKAPDKDGAKGLHRSARTPYGTATPSSSSQGRWSGHHAHGSWGHGPSFGWHRR